VELKLADKVRFGPAGKPVNFKGPTSGIPKFLHDEELDAFEYQAVRGVKISKSDAMLLGKNAKENDVWLTLHGPYFINLSGEPETVKASKQRLILSLKAASWMGAHQVVFHPGFYGSKNKIEALNLCIKSIRQIVEEVKNLGIKNILLGPETTGKQSQVGSLDEIIEMCQNADMTAPTIDWAHIHARNIGGIKSKEDYLVILDKIENKLGSQTMKNLHCHYTPVEYTEKGERRHHVMGEEGFGPDFKHLAQLINELGLKPVIISETPMLDIDALKMKDIVNKEKKYISK
jgi:deoxyribonuclease-4